MTHENEKTVLVHWYYSASEWESFIKREKEKRGTKVVIESLFVCVLVFITIHYGRDASLSTALTISGTIAVVYGLAKYYIRKLTFRWKEPQMPEVVITDRAANVNGKPIVFQGDGKLLRKVDIKENNDINVLEITFEWNTGKGITFDELRIPVPKGKLREAIELLDCLNVRRDVFSLFG